MMDSSCSIRGSDRLEFLWFMRAMGECGIKAFRHFLSLMQQAALQERGRRELSKFDAKMLQDIGLEPFDVYYGWRGPQS